MMLRDPNVSLSPIVAAPPVCESCGRLLDDDELLFGAFCRDCRPLNPTAGCAQRSGRLRVGVEYASCGVRRRYRRGQW